MMYMLKILMMKKMKNEFPSIFGKFFGEKKTNNKQNKKITEKIIYDKPETIIHNIEVSLADIYDQKTKKLIISRKRKVDNKYIDKKKKIEIPIYAREIILENQGDELEGYKNKGDIIINITNKKEDNFKRINDYDILTFVSIELNKLYSSFSYEIILPNKEILLVQPEKFNLNNKCILQKIKKKGLPYENKKGNLYIMYNIIYPKSIDELNEVKQYVDNTNISDLYIIAYNCSIDEIIDD